MSRRFDVGASRAEKKIKSDTRTKTKRNDHAAAWRGFKVYQPKASPDELPDNHSYELMQILFYGDKNKCLNGALAAKYADERYLQAALTVQELPSVKHF